MLQTVQTGPSITEYDLQVRTKPCSPNQPHGGAAHPLTQNQRITSFIKLVDILETNEL